MYLISVDAEDGENVEIERVPSPEPAVPFDDRPDILKKSDGAIGHG